MDWTGLVLLGSGIAGLQYMLDRGTSQDWFAANDIRLSALVAAVGTCGFAWHSLRKGREALFDLRIFKDRNFAIACAAMAALGLGLFGGLVLQPILLEGLLGYPIVTTGFVMAPRGVATAIAMVVVGRLVMKTDPRLLVGTGMLVSALGSQLMTHYSLDVSTAWIIGPAFLQGLGLGLIFVPLSTIAYTTLDRSRMAEAAGIYSLVRTIGAAAGISIVTTLMSRQAQVIWNELGGHVTKFNPALKDYLASLHLSPTDPHAMALVAAQIGREAEMGAMLDVFRVTTWSFLAMLPLVFLLRRHR
jgi:DHA2 family multidrug resistance protein